MPQHSPTTTDHALVEPDWLEHHLDDGAVRVVEIDVSPKPHAEGHIPGAVLWNIYRDLRDEEYQLRPAPAFEDLIRRSGITPESTVVCYGYAPALGFWLLRLFGHHDVRILDTSRATWQADGRPWTADPTQVEPSDYRPAVTSEAVRADRDTLLRWSEQPDAIILDVRSASEYAGERFWPSGGTQESGRTGHIPGAVHLPADGIFEADGSFRSVDELREVMASVDRDRPVVTYCTVGARAATVWFVLSELLGHPDVRVYDGSWAEWGLDPTVAVAAT